MTGLNKHSPGEKTCLYHIRLLFNPIGLGDGTRSASIISGQAGIRTWIPRTKSEPRLGLH